MKPIEAIHDVVVASRSHCTARAAITKLISPTSIASSAQPPPDPNSSLRCRGPNGSRSSRCARVRGAAFMDDTMHHERMGRAGRSDCRAYVVLVTLRLPRVRWWLSMP